MPIVFVPENNQGDLPDKLRTHLLTKCPYLCNWFIYSKQKDFAMGDTFGFRTSAGTKQTGANHLNVYLENRRFKFSKNVPIHLMTKLLKEIENEQATVDVTGEQPIPVISAKQGHHDDGLMCVLMAKIAYISIVLKSTVKLGTFGNKHCSRPCVSCNYYTTGHFAPINNKKHFINDDLNFFATKESAPLKKRKIN